MAYYPTFGTMYYKDKNLDLKIKFKIRLIKLQKFLCSDKKCYIKDNTLSDLCRHFKERRDSKKIGYELYFSEKFHMEVPKDMVEPSGRVLCPECLKEVKPHHIDILKIWPNKVNDYINSFRILRDFTGFRWKQQLSGRWKSTSTGAYPKTIKAAYEDMTWYKRLGRKKEDINKGIIVKFIMNRKITINSLKKDYEKYVERKVAREI
jgi:hypothetical protein